MGVSPHFHVHLHARDSCNQWRCCIENNPPVKNRRLVPISETEIAPERHGFLYSMRRILCCTATAPPEHNEQAVQIFKGYLHQEYGSVAASLASELAFVHLEEKANKGEPLYIREVQAIAEQAALVQEQCEKLSEMVLHLKYFSAAQVAQGAAVDTIVSRYTTPCYSEDDSQSKNSSLGGAPLIIRRKSGIKGSVDPEKLRAAIVQAPVQIPLRPDEIETVMGNVLQILRQLDGYEIPSIIILELIVHELIVMGVKIVPPEFLAQIPEPIKGQLQIKSLEGTLEAKEHLALFTALTGNTPHNMEVANEIIEGEIEITV